MIDLHPRIKQHIMRLLHIRVSISNGNPMYGIPRGDVKL